MAALLSEPWVSGVVAPFGPVSGDAAVAALSVARWLPAVVVGAAIAWAGLSSVGRALAAAVDVLALWIVPPLLTAVTMAVGSRVLAHDLREMTSFAQDVFAAALTTPSVVLPPIVIAAAVAAAGLLARWTLGLRSRPSA